MHNDEEPNLVTSGKSKRVSIDGLVFNIEIFRLETDRTWSLEVVDQDGQAMSGTIRLYPTRKHSALPSPQSRKTAL